MPGVGCDLLFCTEMHGIRPFSRRFGDVCAKILFSPTAASRKKHIPADNYCVSKFAESYPLLYRNEIRRIPYVNVYG